MANTSNLAPSASLAQRRYPRTLGNVWMLEQADAGFRYMSDQYQGEMMGFEERDGLTLAQTPPLALGMVALGHGVGTPRPLPERFEWHVLAPQMSDGLPAFAATSHGVVAQRLAGQVRHALTSVIAMSEPQAGIVASEAQPGSPKYRAVMRQIAMARKALGRWEKTLFVDRICLCLLAGAPQTSLRDALDHYGAVAQALRRDAALAAGQASFPLIVVSQSAGTREDGASEVILAEGRLDVAFPSLGIVVATPKYPFALMQDMPATMDAADQMLIDELEARAVAAVQDGKPWYCPSLRQAYGKGNVIVADFSAMGALTLGEGAHGFALRGCSNDAQIVDVLVKGTTVWLTLDKPPEGGAVHLSYAWGARGEMASATHAGPANGGALREDWSVASVMLPGRVLYRYALSGCVRLMPSDLPTSLPGDVQ